MRYDLTPRLLILIAATAALTATNVASTHAATAPAASIPTLAKQLVAAQEALAGTASKLAAVETVIDQARADVNRIAIELADGRDPRSVTQELQKVRVSVDGAENSLTGVVASLDSLSDTFTKIRRAARTLGRTLDKNSIAVEASLALRRVQTLQLRAKKNQSRVEKLNLDIKQLLVKANG